MVEIPDALLAEQVLLEARENGDFGDVHDTAAEGQFGQHTYDTEWSLADINPSECDVDMDGEVIVVHTIVEAEYSVEVLSARRNPPGKAHPAEYERRTMPLQVSIRMSLGDFSPPVVEAMPA